MPRSDTTLYVGNMRTSTGNISVTKMAQKKNMRNGKRKYTMANADSSDMAILPSAMTSAVTRLTIIICPTGALEPLPPPVPFQAAV